MTPEQRGILHRQLKTLNVRARGSVGTQQSSDLASKSRHAAHRDLNGYEGHMKLAGTIVVGGEKMGYFTPDGKPIEGVGRSDYGRPEAPIDVGELAAADEAPEAEE
jgi:hypothetical protein